MNIEPGKCEVVYKRPVAFTAQYITVLFTLKRYKRPVAFTAQYITVLFTLKRQPNTLRKGHLFVEVEIEGVT